MIIRKVPKDDYSFLDYVVFFVVLFGFLYLIYSFSGFTGNDIVIKSMMEKMGGNTTAEKTYNPDSK